MGLDYAARCGERGQFELRQSTRDAGGVDRLSLDTHSTATLPTGNIHTSDTYVEPTEGILTGGRRRPNKSSWWDSWGLELGVRDARG